MRTCWSCGKRFGARGDALTCSAACRKARQRGRQAPRSARLAQAWGLKPGDFWRTPAWLIAAMRLRYPIGFDACATPEDAVCAQYITPEQNSLMTSWAPFALFGWGFWNPPYGNDLLSWVQKAASERDAGVSSLGLVPPATGSRYMQRADQEAAEICLIRGRIPFIHPDTGKPVSGNRGDSCFIVMDSARPGPARWTYVELSELRDRGVAAMDQVPHRFPISA